MQNSLAAIITTSLSMNSPEMRTVRPSLFFFARSTFLKLFALTVEFGGILPFVMSLRALSSVFQRLTATVSYCRKSSKATKCW